MKLCFNVWLVFAFVTVSQAAEVSKSLSKEFAVNADALLKVSNKYGSIHVENWEKNVVHIDVMITVEAASSAKAQKILNKIDVSISGSSNLVEAVTEYGNMNCTHCSMEVVYIIKMPGTLDVDLYMKYGDLYFDKTSGVATIGVKYGDIEINELGQNSELYMGYSEGDVNKMKEGEVEIRYSELDIDLAGELEVKSQYSDVEIDEVKALEIGSSYDDLNIGHVYALECDGNFSDIEIGTVEKVLILDMNYGGVEVDHVKANFNQVKIFSNYAGVVLDIDESASYKLEAYTNYGTLYYPRGNAKIKIFEKSHTSEEYQGTVGKESNPSSEVYISVKHADVRL